jgi:catechol 2,3-dioxygenase-like lactoylglutathione lyase family enzyme
MTKYLHTMIRVSSLEDTIAFFGVLGLPRNPTPAGRKGPLHQRLPRGPGR